MEKTMRLTLLVYEPDEKKRDIIRSAIKLFAARHDADVRIDWMFRAEQEEQIPRIMPDILVAFVNAEMGERSAIAGRRIYDANPECFLVYYGKPKKDISPLLPARPVAYNPTPDSFEAWEIVLRELTYRIRSSNRYFHWTNKDRSYYLPYRSITHIRSERVYLDVFTPAGSSFRLVGKLDEAAKQLPPPVFLRIHQSELVNTNRVHVIDRSRRCLIMDDGSELYISRAHYREVLEWFERRQYVSRRDAGAGKNEPAEEN